MNHRTTLFAGCIILASAVWAMSATEKLTSSVPEVTPTMAPMAMPVAAGDVETAIFTVG